MADVAASSHYYSYYSDQRRRLWRNVQTSLMSLAHNWDLSRAYHNNYSRGTAIRSEGFTETWGGISSSNRPPTTTTTTSTNVDDDADDENESEHHHHHHHHQEGYHGAGENEDCWQREQDFVTQSLLPPSLQSSSFFISSILLTSSASSSFSASSASSSQSSRSPLLLLLLYQYRPCWCEQLACRVAGLPYVVVNQPFAVCEVAGPLPMLLDHFVVSPPAPIAVAVAAATTKTKTSAAPVPRPPVVVGRNENRTRRDNSHRFSHDATGGGPYSNNDILLYLEQCHGLDLNPPENSSSSLSFMQPQIQQQQQAQAQSLLLQSLIGTTLHDCLIVLRYQDRHAWEQVNRRQCLQAAAGHGYHRYHDDDGDITGRKQRSSSSLWLLGLSGMWQTRSERLQAQSRLSPLADTWSVEQAIQQARVAYRILEVQLQSTAAAAAATTAAATAATTAATAATGNNSDGGASGTSTATSYCLLHPTKITLVDVLLWDHLANALADVHLVTVLAEFPRLCRFAEYIWESYFAVESSTNNNSNNSDAAAAAAAEPWQLWNAAENARNAFCQIPFLSTPSAAVNNSNSDKNGIIQFHDAVQLMETLSVTSLTLQERLALGAKMRKEEKRQALQYSTLQRQTYRSAPPTTTSASAASASNTGKRPQSATRQAAAAAKAYQYADQVWLATVVVATIVGIAAGITGATRNR
jgi:hypothetical protein